MVRKVFNIPSSKRIVELYKRHGQCDLHNIYHKNGRAPIAHVMDVLYKARNDDGDTTKRSWVLLALATVLTRGMGNMVPLEYLKSLEEIEKVTEYAWDEHVLSVAMNEVKKCHEKIKSHDITKFWVEGNTNAAAQDVDCDDTQDCGAEDVNINGNKDDVCAKYNHIEDINPMENGKSAEEDVCGSLDDWLQNLIPFGIELEVSPHLAEIYDKHTKLYVAELKGATNSFVQVLQAKHCRRMGRLLKDVHLVSSSNQQAMDVTFYIPPHCSNDAPKVDEHGGSKQTSSSEASDEHGGGKQSYSRKVADEPTTDKVVVYPAKGAQSNRSSSSGHEPNACNVVDLSTESSADANQANAEKDQVGVAKMLSMVPN
ncbi:cytokinin-o-glucosyltransferase 2 [Hordeum vulgare]|nr:cytokinin-o-glucosyltransferase 2 [Hordeum vulgare]